LCQASIARMSGRRRTGSAAAGFPRSTCRITPPSLARTNLGNQCVKRLSIVRYTSLRPIDNGALLRRGTDRKISSHPPSQAPRSRQAGIAKSIAESRFFEPLAQDSFPLDYAFVSTAI
jgi:hypothetical protein